MDTTSMDNGGQTINSGSPSGTGTTTPKSDPACAIESHVKKSTGNDTDYTIFEPQLLENDTYEALAVKATKLKMRSRFIRVSLIFFIPFVVLLLNEFFKDDDNVSTDLMFTFGVSLLLMYTAYFINLFTTVTGACASNLYKIGQNNVNDTNLKRIHRIYSLNVVYPSWSGMTFTAKALFYKNHAITSISEFSAVMGGTANVMLTIISSYGFAVLICGIASEQVTKGFDFTFDIFAELLGIYGTVLIGAFELDKFSKPMVTMHYVGVVFAVFTVIGFIVQAHKIGHKSGYDDIWRIVVAWCLLVFAGATGGYWMYLGEVAKKFAQKCGSGENAGMSEEQIAARITKLSYMNIFFEGCAIFAGALATCLWLMSFERCRLLDCY